MTTKIRRASRSVAVCWPLSLSSRSSESDLFSFCCFCCCCCLALDYSRPVSWLEEEEEEEEDGKAYRIATSFVQLVRSRWASNEWGSDERTCPCRSWASSSRVDCCPPECSGCAWGSAGLRRWQLVAGDADADRFSGCTSSDPRDSRSAFRSCRRPRHLWRHRCRRRRRHRRGPFDSRPGWHRRRRRRRLDRPGWCWCSWLLFLSRSSRSSTRPNSN